MGVINRHKGETGLTVDMKVSILLTVTALLLCLSFIQAVPLPQLVGAGPSAAFIRNQKSGISGTTTQQRAGKFGNRPAINPQNRCRVRYIGRRRVRTCSY